MLDAPGFVRVFRWLMFQYFSHLLLACTQAWPPALPSGQRLLAGAVVARDQMWPCSQPE